MLFVEYDQPKPPPPAESASIVPLALGEGGGGGDIPRSESAKCRSSAAPERAAPWPRMMGWRSKSQLAPVEQQLAIARPDPSVPLPSEVKEDRRIQAES